MRGDHKTTLSRDYEILEVLGEGSNGLVYLVRDRRDGVLHAVKEFSFSGESAQRFVRELSILFTLHHPNIIRCTNFIYSGAPGNYLFMEYASGGSLRRRLAEKPMGLGSEETCVVARHMALALGAAHEKNIIHCDVKPENILLQETGSREFVFKLADLGISFHTARDQAPRSRGTPVYMAPEQFFDRPVPASDFYSLGVVLYECLAGVPPFSGCAEQLFVDHQQNEPDYSKIPHGPWRRILPRFLAKSPCDRFASAEEILESLAEFDPATNGWNNAKKTPSIIGVGTKPQLPGRRPSPIPEPSFLPAPGAFAIFNLGDADKIHTADPGSVDAYDLETGAVRRQVWVGKYSCSAVAAESGDALFILSGKLWVRRAGGTVFRVSGRDTYCADAACIHPLGDFFVTADRMQIQANTFNGRLLWSAPCANYFIAPVILCLRDGRVLAGTGPANPALQVFSARGDFIARFPLPGPLLALAPGGGEGADAMGVVQGLSADDPAKIVEISPAGVRTVAGCVPGVFRASWHGNFFSLLTCHKQAVLCDLDGSGLQTIGLEGDPLGDAVCAGGYAVLIKPPGPAAVRVFRFAPGAARPRQRSLDSQPLVQNS